MKEGFRRNFWILTASDWHAQKKVKLEIQNATIQVHLLKTQYLLNFR